MYQRISREEYETIISAIKNELAFIRRNYGDSLIEELEKLVDQLSEIDYISPFTSQDVCFERDDIGIGNYHSLGEVGRSDTSGVENVFNVELNSHGDNHIVLTRRIIRSSSDDGSYLQSMIDVPIFDSLKEIYVNCNEVVGFKNIALGWSWYYQDFVDIDKEYY